MGGELGCWACGGPVEGPLWAPGGALSVHEWGMAPPGKKCVLRDTIMCDASMCADGEGCHASMMIPQHSSTQGCAQLVVLCPRFFS